MIRYAITNFSDRFDLAQANKKLYPNESMEIRATVHRWVRGGIDIVQLREKQLGGGDLLALAADIQGALQGSATRLLINRRLDVAIAAGAAGVHLTAQPGELTPGQVRECFSGRELGQTLISVSCHTAEEVQRAVRQGADLVLFGPVYEKRVHQELVQAGQGLNSLREAVRAAGSVPLLALGGVTSDNAGLCREAGAKGFASIRAFA